MAPHGKQWRVIDLGNVPADAPWVAFDCPNCGEQAYLPIAGLPIAQLPDGIVFDSESRDIPRIIECRACRKRFERAA
jgi:hypothetical protein